MESYTKLIPNQGGDIGKHIRMKDSDAWKILKKTRKLSNSLVGCIGRQAYG
jgi:hypothetical protein